MAKRMSRMEVKVGWEGKGIYAVYTSAWELVYQLMNPDAQIK